MICTAIDSAVLVSDAPERSLNSFIQLLRDIVYGDPNALVEVASSSKHLAMMFDCCDTCKGFIDVLTLLQNRCDKDYVFVKVNHGTLRDYLQRAHPDYQPEHKQLQFSWTDKLDLARQCANCVQGGQLNHYLESSSYLMDGRGGVKLG